ncbi:MAG: hypothetical protein GX751_05385 [Desulfuromonadaceae bacterium]|nr:hypothetical protein [Desulfuromonadaceae bacterium]
MGLIFWRQVLASLVIVAAVMAWWFPAPRLIRAELIDWGRLYEVRYAPSGSGLGALGVARAVVRSATEPQPLSRFVESRTAGHTVVGTDPGWGAVFADLEEELRQGRPALRYIDPKVAPFAALSESHRYLAWPDKRGLRYLAYRFLPAAEFASHSIPSEIQFPLRSYRWLLSAGGCVALFLGFSLGKKPDLVEGSSAGKGLRWTAVGGVFFAAMIAWPFVYRSVGSGMSYASIMVGGLLTLGALVGMILFGNQVRLLRRLIEEGGHLAHFTYTPEEWAAFAHWNYGEESAQKRSLWLMIFVITLAVGVAFMLIMRDEASVWVFAVLMGLMALLWVFAAGLPKLALRRHLRGPGQVYLGAHCLYLNGSVHTWNFPGARFEKAAFQSKPRPHLLVTYSCLTMAGRTLYFWRQNHKVPLPVPAGAEEKGKKVAAQLLGSR